MPTRYKTDLRTFFCIFVLFAAVARPTRAQYVIYGAYTNQVINGFGVNINHRSWNGDELKPVLDTMISQGGFTQFRVVFDNTDWATTNNTSQEYYNSIYGSARFEKLWDIIGYLNQKGITNGIIFSFMGPGPQWMGGGSLYEGYEPQWAQMIYSLLAYARNTRHLQFNLVAPDNEPDIGAALVGIGASDTQYVTMLHDLAQLLDANGMGDIRLIGPDLAITDVTWIQQMMRDSLVMSSLAYFGMHSYQSGGADSGYVSNYIATSQYPASTFTVTEFNSWCSNCYEGVYDTNDYDWSFCSGTAENLLYYLANGAAGGLAWEGYDSYYELLPLASLPYGQQAAGWSFYGLFGVNDTNAVPKTYTPRKNFYTLAQITAFVPPGSQSIALSGIQNSLFGMRAFYHAASGRVTLTGFNYAGQMSIPITLTSLPPVASFALYYTDPDMNLNQSAIFAVTNGNFTAVIPSNCIFTLTGFDPAKIAVSVQMSNPAPGQVYSAPATIPLAALASTTTGSITNVEFFSGVIDLGGSRSPPYGVLWSNATPGTYTITAQAYDSAGHTNRSPPLTLTITGSPAQIIVVPTNTIAILPANTVLSPYSQQQFAATVVDALGNPLSPQPAVTWLVSGGGTINSNGWFVAGTSIGGPFNVTATNGGLSGSASVIIASNVNLAPFGIGYIWYNLFSNTGNTPQTEAPGINDGDTNTSVSLLAEGDGSEDFTNAYEAAGVVWTIPQTIQSIVFVNGATTPTGDGTFDATFQLQFTQDGSTWVPAGPQWTFTPAYNYNSTWPSPIEYVFSGSCASVLGVRCAGMVNTGPTNSWFDFAAEVQAYAGVLPPTPQVSLAQNGVIVSWPGPVTNWVLQATSNLTSASWTNINNARNYDGTQTSVTINPGIGQQYFRLQNP